MIAEVRVLPIARQDQSALRHLIDLYAYDFSDLLGLDVEESGRFAFPDLGPYWTDSWRHPFFIRAGDKLAGFALVHARSRLTGADGIHDMAEFFVLRRHRRQGVGARAAGALFALFRGPWEIRERAENTAALAFWRRVIDRHTGGQFREETWANELWRGPVQRFTS
jgi:predicted acetyltransferase